MSLVFIILGYVYFCIPCILCCCLCLCLPVLIILMIHANPNRQNPATEDAINKLEVTKYNQNENHVCKECVICCQTFIDYEEIITLE